LISPTLGKILNSIQALVTDYDETIATDGVVSAQTLAALARFRGSGRKLILNTGRVLRDLTSVFSKLALFDLVVVENGAVLYDPHVPLQTLLAPPPPQALLDALRRRSIPMLVGEVALETSSSYLIPIREAIEESGVPRDLAFNKSSVLILPPGVDKGSGLRAALGQLGISPEHAAGIGDAENDHALLAACGLAVAVPHAIPALKQQAGVILSAVELIGRILTPNEEHSSGLRA
jgi:hydroxymethylpyrimidine pyrophosphatase-like HAD family hydrolase